MFSDPFEDALRVVEQRAFEERECARVLEWDDDRYVLLQESEAGFAPLEFFSQVAVERDLAQLARFLLPLLCVGNFRCFSLVRQCRTESDLPLHAAARTYTLFRVRRSMGACIDQCSHAGCTAASLEVYTLLWVLSV